MFLVQEKRRQGSKRKMNEPETFGWFMARLGILLFFIFYFHSIPFSSMNINANLPEG